ncbi:protein O-mannosyl-transferase TMTC2 [Gracilinanus agilis]|uniref:protein O-mannosyl-transferase TMTC2 n=1 Tax=Gracilinanus agilis TaxID=191870 RepID=UPI001CFEC22A|nr:protein O-mannosyl-transferase TMTC2 [Gracilinanus agilis]
MLLSLLRLPLCWKASRREGGGEMIAELVSSALGLVLYLNTLSADFCYDDSRAIKTNQDLLPETPWTHIFYNDFWGTLLTHSGSHKSYRPLCTLSFRFNHAIGGLNPWSYHLVNVLLHAAVTGLFTSFSKILLGDGHWTFIAGLMFASHPIHTEAVAGIVGRADVGASFFFLLSLLCYVKHCSTRGSTSSSWGWFLGTGLCAGCSMLWKEQGVTVLAVSAVYDVFVFHRLKMDQIIPSIYKRKNVPLFLSVGLLTFWGTSLLGARLYWMGNKPPSFSNSDNPAADSDSVVARTLTFLYLPTKNLWLLLCPDTLSFDWSMDAVPLIKTICDWRNLHTVAFYTGLFLLAYFSLRNPSTKRECNGKAIPNGKQNVNGHSCHPDAEYQDSEPKPSFSEKVENGIKNHVPQQPSLPSTENIVVLSLSLLIVPFVPATNLFFYVGFVIAERVLYIPSMGFCLLITVGARALYVKAQKRFLKNLIFYATGALIVFYGLKTAIRNGDWQNEEMLYRSGIKVNPAKAWGNLGNVLKSQSKISEAENAYRNALYYRSNMADMLYNLLHSQFVLQTLILLFSWLDEGHYEEALTVYKEAIQKMPRQFAPQSLYNMMGEAYLRLSKLPEAEHWYVESLRSKTDHIPAHLTYGKLLALTGRKSEAEKFFLKAIQLDPTRGNCYMHYGQFLLEEARVMEAAEMAQKAAELDSDEFDVVFNAAHMLSLYRNLSTKTAFPYCLLCLLSRDGFVIREITFKRLVVKGHCALVHLDAYNTTLGLYDFGKGTTIISFLGERLLEKDDTSNAAVHWISCCQKESSLKAAIFFRFLSLPPLCNAACGLICGQDSLMAILLSSYPAALMNLGAILHLNGRLLKAEANYLQALQLKPDDVITQSNLRKLWNIMEKQGLKTSKT